MYTTKCPSLSRYLGFGARVHTEWQGDWQFWAGSIRLHFLPDLWRQSSDAIVRNPQFHQPLEPNQILSYRAHTHPSNITHPKRPPAPYSPHVPRQPRGAPKRRHPRSHPLIDSYRVQSSQLRLLAELPLPAVYCVCRLIGYEASVGETPCLEHTQLSRFHKCSHSWLERGGQSLDRLWMRQGCQMQPLDASPFFGDESCRALRRASETSGRVATVLLDRILWGCRLINDPRTNRLDLEAVAIDLNQG